MADTKPPNILINRFLKTPLELKDYALPQAIGSLIACAAAFTGIAMPEYVSYSTSIVTLYCLFDLPFVKWDSFIHHIIILACRLFVVNAENHRVVEITLDVYRMEYSTVFLSLPVVLKEFLPMVTNPSFHRNLHKTDVYFNTGFIVLFFKYRIVEFARKNIFPETAYNWIIDEYNGEIIPIARYFVILSGFYLLNLYWGALIIKRLYRTFLRSIDTISVCENITRYTVLLAIASTTCGYSLYSLLSNAQMFWKVGSGKHLTDMQPVAIHLSGLSILSLTSYKFHAYLYNSVKSNPDGTNEYPKLCNAGIWLLTDDSCAISLHTFCAFLSSTWYIQSWRFIANAAIMGSICAIISKINGRLVQRLEGRHLTSAHIASINSASVVGVALVLCNSVLDNSFERTANVAMIHFVFCYSYWLVVFIQPLNRLTHVALHLLLATHHYFIALQVVDSLA